MAAKILLQGSVLRATYGLFALLLPKLLNASAGIREDEVDPDARYLNRLFGGRDLLVAGLTVAAVRAGDERHATNINLICEGTDTVSLLEELRARRGVDRTLAIGIAFNVAGYATWLRALRALRG
jgi:hypothetical protein